MRYVALLRAINVGTANRVKMVDLVASLFRHGIDGAKTYLQSGNVIFDSSGSPNEAEEAFEKAFAELGLKSFCVLRTAKQMAEIAAVDAFLGRPEPEKLQFVTFLRLAFEEPLTTDASSEILLRTPTEVYWVASPQVGKAPVGPRFPLKVRSLATSRNWIVTRALAELAAVEA